MIDENLPTFFLKNTSKTPQQSTIYHRQHGNDPEPVYTLRALDPALPTSNNRYGVALYDPYVTDVVYGEVAVVPEWTQPSLSADTIRANGGAAPPPEPILPTEFTIQLYNPDQEIIVKHQAKTWNRPARWEFEMPQRTFRVPSASTLDRTQSDPSAADVTPKLRFSWRKDGKLSKDLSCLLHGKTSTIPDTRSKSREPDITVALFQGLKELTLYEPNLYRVEMEDFKGLEVVLLLAAVAIRDIFFGPAKEAFHITAGGPSTVGTRPQATPAGGRIPQTQAAGAIPNSKASPPRSTIPDSKSPASQARKRQDELAAEEARRTQELLAAEKRSRQKAQLQRQADVDNETKRLQQIYGREEQQARQQKPTPDLSPRPHLPPRHSEPSRPSPYQFTQSYSHLPSQGPPQPPRHARPQRAPQSGPVPTFAASPYLQPSGRMDPRVQSTAQLMPRPQIQPRPQSHVGFYPTPASSGAFPAAQQPTQQVQPKKSSFFGFKRNKEESSGRNRLDKKRSSMF
ncbi:uncharacterized protein N7498_002580 [Penicillium cinerascens]|uniref:Uncharacterized protein n=1 Tax=Penicillium cinerascens TaxID=70096 RepID=A0A9W9NC18_9EURO|nr:uncharacterized protein N7498_002580 [Penicillium cinerascens]KAJ5216173.1 hypothetical protein N7498_002580 [Penicillium cinerascens]